MGVPHEDFTTEVGPSELRESQRRGGDAGLRPALLICWSAEEPQRVGELFLPPRRVPGIIGRGDAPAGAELQRVLPVRQVPGDNLPRGALSSRKLSRQQLRIEVTRQGRLRVRNLGRRSLLHRRLPTTEATLEAGDIVELEGLMLLLCVERPSVLPKARTQGTAIHRHGSPDAHGLVGESPALWALRDQLAFVGPRPGHVLVTGPSGSGKELVARALHGHSQRAGRPLVSRNAATIPDALMDAELFGNVRNYPNPGMAERPGLVGQAHHGTLFLDEIGELPVQMQAHLLRLMDAGEYQRLGDATARTADVRIIAATNRDPQSLKADFAARFRHLIRVPPLSARRGDVPLLLRHLLCSAAREDPELRARYFEGDEPRISVELVRSLLRHRLLLQVREIDTILWRCLGASRGDVVELDEPADPATVDPEATDPRTISREDLLATMEHHEWVQEKAWRALSLQSRYVLRRLLKKHDIQPPS